MGIVYAGIAEEPDGRERQVAVKVIHPHLADAPEFRTRFRSEAALAARVARFCTAAVLDVDVEGEQPYLVTEFVDGPTLQEVVDEQGPLSGGALDAVAIGIATALVAIHEAGIVHRDLKPSNVILSRFGPRVIDFGIARAADLVSGLTSGAIGSPPYMAPEQFRGDPITAATDIHAWGAAVCFAGTSQPPFGVAAPEVMLFRTLEQTADVSSLDEPIRDLAAAALSKDPAERPTSRHLLETLALHRPGAVPDLPLGAPTSERAAARGAASPGLASVEPASTGVASDSTTAQLNADGRLTAQTPTDAARPQPGPPPVAEDTAAEDAVTPDAPRRRRRAPLLVAGALVTALAAGAALWATSPWQAAEPTTEPSKVSDLTVRQYDADDGALGPATPPSSARRGGTVVLFATAQYWELDPTLNRYADGMMVSNRLLARTLTSYRRASGRTTLVGDLATDTGRSTDGGRTWEFTIRPGVTFANGRAVTAEDVAHGVGRSFGTKGGFDYLERWLAGRDDFRAAWSGPTASAQYPPGIEVLDARTIRFRFARPHPDFPAVAALPSTAAVPKGWKPTKTEPVPVTGPYKVAAVGKDELTLERNPAWNPESDPIRTDYPDRYVVRFNVERDDVTTQLMADEEPTGIQLGTMEPFRATEAYQRGVANRLVEGDGQGHRDLCFNTQRVKDPKLRQALSLAFNPEAALAALGGIHVGTLTTSLLSRRLPGYPPDQIPGQRFGDPDTAVQQLDGADVTLVLGHMDNPDGERFAPAIQAAFARAGVKVSLRPIPYKRYEATIGRRDNPYDIYLCSWAPDYLDGNAMLPLRFGGDTIRAAGNTNLSYLDVPALDAEFARVAALPDRRVAAEEYAKLDRRIREQYAPAIPFFDQRRLALRGSAVGSLFVSPLWGVPDLAQAWVRT
ncbi:hypothetical protein GCM10020369_31830 [Cryptosporangium minutisporangium]|uniref:Protein kinase domain-containing protein n=2 Tax=Cryptosporangium minutisporangium TaxID=113569 RepID=A0ABP6SYV1_9ACTN